jgi:hypothetical protein
MDGTGQWSWILEIAHDDFCRREIALLVVAQKSESDIAIYDGEPFGRARCCAHRPTILDQVGNGFLYRDTGDARQEYEEQHAFR